MSTTVIRPGAMTLAEWRAIYDGGDCSLDPAALPRVARAADTVAAIVARGEPVYGINTGFGKLAGVRIAAGDLATLQRNLVLSHAAGVGEAMPVPVARLMMALKLACLGQGASGVRLTTLAMLGAMLGRGLTPVVPCQGSVGASGDLAPLAHMTATLLGVGRIFVDGRTLPAGDALAAAGLTPADAGAEGGTGATERDAVFDGLRPGWAIRGECRLSGGPGERRASPPDAARGSDAPFDERIHLLRRHPGQARVAAALRGLMAGSAIRLSHLANDDRVQDPYCLRCQPQVMGAVLDLLGFAARTLETEANGVSDNPLVFPETGESLSGGNFHAEPVAFAADQIAIALCEIGSLAERRVAMLVDPALSGLPAFLSPRSGLNSGFMIPQVTAAALVAENKTRAMPASVDSIPTSANQEDHVSMAAHAARRLPSMAENAAAVVAIELLAAAQGCDFLAPLASSPPLERVRALVRSVVPMLEDDRHLHPDIEAAIRLVRSGAVVEAAGPELLPTLVGDGYTPHGQG